jgi:Na+/melibiose symporter-like transporter
MFIRLRVPESPAFTRIKQRGEESRLPLLDILRNHRAAAVLAIGVALVNIAGFNIVTTFTLSYLTGQLGLPRSVPLTGNLLAGIADILAIFIFAVAADRPGKRRVAIWAAASTVPLPYAFFWLVDTGKPVLIWLAMSVWICASGGLWSLTGVLIADLFPARVRYSGAALGYNIVGIIGGAPVSL